MAILICRNGIYIRSVRRGLLLVIMFSTGCTSHIGILGIIAQPQRDIVKTHMHMCHCFLKAADRLDHIYYIIIYENKKESRLRLWDMAVQNT